MVCVLNVQYQDAVRTSHKLVPVLHVILDLLWVKETAKYVKQPIVNPIFKALVIVKHVIMDILCQTDNVLLVVWLIVQFMLKVLAIVILVILAIL